MLACGQDTVHGPEQGRESFIVKTNHNTSNWQVSRVRLVFTCRIPRIWHISMVAQAVTNKQIEGMFLIAQVSQLLIAFIKNHTQFRREFQVAFFWIFNVIIYHIINFVCFELWI